MQKTDKMVFCSKNVGKNVGKIRLGQCKLLQVKKKEVKLGWVNILREY